MSAARLLAHPQGAAALIERIRRSVIGDDPLLDGPFGPRRVVYADYMASGRSLTFIEDFTRDRVLPLYANTHTEASTGFQTTALREQARGIVHRAVNGGDDDVVVFPTWRRHSGEETPAESVDPGCAGRGQRRGASSAASAPAPSARHSGE